MRNNSWNTKTKRFDWHIQLKNIVYYLKVKRMITCKIKYYKKHLKKDIQSIIKCSKLFLHFRIKTQKMMDNLFNTSADYNNTNNTIITINSTIWGYSSFLKIRRAMSPLPSELHGASGHQHLKLCLNSRIACDVVVHFPRRSHDVKLRHTCKGENTSTFLCWVSHTNADRTWLLSESHTYTLLSLGGLSLT